MSVAYYANDEHVAPAAASAFRAAKIARSVSFAIIFAMSTLPFILMIGAGVDYLRMSKGANALHEIARKGAMIACSDIDSAKVYVDLNRFRRFVNGVTLPSKGETTGQ